MRSSGAMVSQRLLCLDLVKKYPGRSSKQLAELGGLDRTIPGRRLKELESQKHVKRTQAGNDDCLWWAV